MSEPLPGEQIKVSVTLAVNESGLLDLSFSDIPVDGLPALLDSLGSERFVTMLVQKLNDEIAETARKADADG